MQAEGVVVLHIETVWKSQNRVMSVDVFKVQQEKPCIFWYSFSYAFWTPSRNRFTSFVERNVIQHSQKALPCTNEGQERNSDKVLLPCSERTDTTRDAEMQIWYISAHRPVKTLALPKTLTMITSLCSTHGIQLDKPVCYTAQALLPPSASLIGPQNRSFYHTGMCWQVCEFQVAGYSIPELVYNKF